MNRLAKILLDSSRPPERLGPKTAMPASRSRSPTPAAIAVSGPSTTRSILSVRHRCAMALPSVAFSSQFSPRDAVPALPGAAKTASQDGDRAIRHESASSRAPLPTTRTRNLLPLHGRGRLGRYVVGDAIDARDFVDDAGGNPLEQFVRQTRPVGGHAVFAGDGTN